MPSTTSGPSVLALLLKDSIATSSLSGSAVVHSRTASLSNTVLPCGLASPSTGLGEMLAVINASEERGWSAFVRAE